MQAPKGRKGILFFVINTTNEFLEGKCPAMINILFFRPSGLVIFIFLTRGFTPGYILSALRACCRAKRLFALQEMMPKLL